MSLVQLPYELVSYVIRHLDLTDICNLSYSCKRFQFLAHEASITKILLECRAPFSTETRDARVTKSYAASLRRLIKRREAIASVSPYLVSIVAFAQEWLYENGVLCYLDGRRQLRVLDLHRSASSEIVVDLRKLLHEVLEESRTRHKYKVKLLYYSHNVVSCHYTQTSCDQAEPKHWLLALNPLEGRIVTVHKLRSTSKLFVRNNDRFLYYGTTIDPDNDGDEQWVIRGYDMTTRSCLGRPPDIFDAIGTDIGSTVCFEIFDGYFYCLSNQRSLHVEEVDWLSYYFCFRFPLTPDGFRRVEEPPERQHWRRDHKEGPIDNRWTFLRMIKDEATGRLMAVESRKEWLEGDITPTRTYYTTPINFGKPQKDRGERGSLDGAGPDILTTKDQQEDGEVPRRRPRDPHLVHPGDDSSTLDVTLTRCPVRSYHPVCQTFIDLVDDSASYEPTQQRLRIRGGTRRLRAPSEHAQRYPVPAAEGEQDRDALLQQIDSLYSSETGIFWPPEQDPTAADAALADLYGILSPPGYAGSTQGSWDERSMVYATGGTVGGLKALVFVSWDPSIYLAGTAPYPGHLRLGRPGSCPDGNRKAGCRPPPAAGLSGRTNTMCSIIPERYPTATPNVPPCLGGSDRSEPGTPLGIDGSPVPISWRTIVPAKYREISRGYHFAL